MKNDKYQYVEEGNIISHTVAIGASHKSPIPWWCGGCEAWFVTSPSRTDYNGLHYWIDQSGNTVQLLSRGIREDGDEVLESRDSVQTFNLHPALRFSRAAVLMDAVLRYADLAQATVVGVLCPDFQPSTDARLYAVSGRDTSAVTKNKVIHS